MPLVTQTLSENSSKKRWIFWISTAFLFFANWIWVDELKLNYPSILYTLIFYLLVVSGLKFYSSPSVPLTLKVVLFFLSGWILSLILHVSLWAIFDADRFVRYFQDSLANGTILEGLLFQFQASLLLGGGIFATLIGIMGEVLFGKAKKGV